MRILDELRDLAATLDYASESTLDALPYGLIQLGPDGRVRRYNKAEGRLSRRDPKAQLGRHFFDEVAPCTRVPAFLGRVRAGLERKRLHESFAFTFELPSGRQEVAVTLYYSPASDSVWVALARDADAVAAARAGG